MLKIRFSHHYFKLDGAGKTATLVHAGSMRVDADTPPRLLWYDTGYPVPARGEAGFWHLEPGDYVLLLFVSETGRLFTTIRSRRGRYGDKLEYYSQHIGEDFEIVVKEEDNG